MIAEVNAAGDVPSAAETTLGKGLSFWFLVSGYSGAPVLLPGRAPRCIRGEDAEQRLHCFRLRARIRADTGKALAGFQGSSII